jgi:hypothetical protein
VTIQSDRLAEDKGYFFEGIYSDENGTFTQNTIKSYSDKLQGTFRLSLNNTPIIVNSKIDIPYNVDPNDLQIALRRFPGMEKTQVDSAGD